MIIISIGTIVTIIVNHYVNYIVTIAIHYFKLNDVIVILSIVLFCFQPLLKS